MRRVGVVGATGLMGHGIARNIVTNFPLAFTLRRPSERVANLVAAGAEQVATNADLGRTCDVVVLCVTSSADVEQVVLGDGGLLTEPRDGLVIIDTSTSEPSSTLRLAEACAAHRVRFVDAPLTLGPAEAEAGTLNVLVGADDEAFEEVRPVIEAFAGRILRPGGTGAGHTLKLVNNFVIQAIASSLAEGFAVAAKAGLDPKDVERILGYGTADSRLLHLVGRALDGDFAGMVFQLDNARKDVRYYTRLAGDVGVPAPVGDGVHEALAIASALGFGGEYVPALVKAQAALNGLEIVSRSRP